jgi:hypothetical protein
MTEDAKELQSGGVGVTLAVHLRQAVGNTANPCKPPVRQWHEQSPPDFSGALWSDHQAKSAELRRSYPDYLPYPRPAISTTSNPDPLSPVSSGQSCELCFPVNKSIFPARWPQWLHGKGKLRVSVPAFLQETRSRCLLRKRHRSEKSTTRGSETNAPRKSKVRVCIRHLTLQHLLLSQPVQLCPRALRQHCDQEEIPES